jgi:hypothetical protein
VCMGLAYRQPACVIYESRRYIFLSKENLGCFPIDELTADSIRTANGQHVGRLKQ